MVLDRSLTAITTITKKRGIPPLRIEQKYDDMAARYLYSSTKNIHSSGKGWDDLYAFSYAEALHMNLSAMDVWKSRGSCPAKSLLDAFSPRWRRRLDFSEANPASYQTGSYALLAA